MIRTLLLIPLLLLTVSLLASPGALAQSTAQQESQAASDGKININTASKADLLKLKGVGPGLADKIIDYRKANGPFKKPEDIRKIQGFGKGLWEKNSETISVK